MLFFFCILATIDGPYGCTQCKNEAEKIVLGFCSFFLVVLLSYVSSSVWRFVSRCARVRSYLRLESPFFSFVVTFPRPPLHCQRYLFTCIGRQRLNTFAHIAAGTLFFLFSRCVSSRIFFLVASVYLEMSFIIWSTL